MPCFLVMALSAFTDEEINPIAKFENLEELFKIISVVHFYSKNLISLKKILFINPSRSYNARITWLYKLLIVLSRSQSAE